ncbi:MAG: PilT/PilU family type 4a pilus ATPase [Planctomycetes bacterium]|nr:PilT/PilU family type 4a pilus ATPase [Planctomycetota bacterium]
METISGSGGRRGGSLSARLEDYSIFAIADEKKGRFRIMLQIQELLKIMVRERGSDLVLKTGGFPALRVHGLLRFLSDERIDHAFATATLADVLDERAKQAFAELGQADCAYELPETGRFRVNAFRQGGDPAFVLRHIRSDVPDFRDLNLPVDQLKQLAQRKRGLVLATGVAGSGKSTTLASMLEFINRSTSKHIVTIEDPIEFQFEDKLSVVNQREVGIDTPDFTSALRACMRQSPDVILIGEIRDRDTVEAAIAAAETGHLVFSTMHTVNAVQTVERFLTFFPPHQHQLIRLQLSLNLAGVISLRLVRRLDNSGLVPAVELLLSTPSVREILAEGRTTELARILGDGAYYGTQTFNQSLRHLYETGNISFDDAIANSDNPDELKMLFRGIQSGAKLEVGGTGMAPKTPVSSAGSPLLGQGLRKTI